MTIAFHRIIVWYNKEAILALEDVSHFCGFIQAFSMVGSIVNEVAGLKVQSTTKLTTTYDFFHK